MGKEKIYYVPQVEIITVDVEHGFAQSGDFELPDQENDNFNNQ